MRVQHRLALILFAGFSACSGLDGRAQLPQELSEVSGCESLELVGEKRANYGGVTVDYIDTFELSAEKSCLERIHSAALSAGFEGDRSALVLRHGESSWDELVFDWENNRLQWVDWET